MLILITQVLESRSENQRRRSDTSDEERPRKRYTIQLKSLRTYKGKNLCKHKKWFQDLRDIIKINIFYF